MAWIIGMVAVPLDAALKSPQGKWRFEQPERISPHADRRQLRRHSSE